MKYTGFTIACFLIIAISGSVGWWLKAVQPRPLPTIEWVQEKIGVKADGKLCKSWNVPGHSDTQKEWDLDINQQYADVWNFYYEK